MICLASYPSIIAKISGHHVDVGSYLVVVEVVDGVDRLSRRQLPSGLVVLEVHLDWRGQSADLDCSGRFLPVF